MLILNSKFPFIHKDTRATLENPSTSLEEYFGAFGGGISKAGVAVNENTAITLSAVWRAINILAGTLASLPINLYRREANGDATLIENDPGIKLFKIAPNPLQTPFTFLETMQTGLLTWGNAYAHILKTGTGQPYALKLFHPSRVILKAKEDSFNVYYDITNYARDIPARDILHIPGLGYDGYLGKSPIGVARDSLGGALGMQEFGNAFFKGGAMQSGVLEHPEQLGDIAYNRLKESFNRKYAGLANAGGTMILEEGLKYNPLSFPLEQIQFLGLRKFSVTEVARWYGVPPHFLADLERATYSNIEQQSIEFVIFSLRTWVKRWEQELDKKLLTTQQKGKFYYSFNLEALLRGDSKARGEFYRVLLDLGVISINEVRHLENLNSIKDGEKHLVQLARTPLDKVGEQQNKTIK